MMLKNVENSKHLFPIVAVIALYLLLQATWGIWGMTINPSMNTTAHISLLAFCLAIMGLCSLTAIILIGTNPTLREQSFTIKISIFLLIFILIMTIILSWIEVTVIDPGILSGNSFHYIMAILFILPTPILIIMLAQNSLDLGKENEYKLRKIAEEKEKHIRTQLDLLQAYISPHFIFNSLNTLGSLCETNPTKAQLFVQNMAILLRYMLQHKNTRCVSLKDELANLSRYMHLIHERFGEEIQLTTSTEIHDMDFNLIPGTLQILVENAIKHNIHTLDHPLVINIFIKDSKLFIVNKFSPFQDSGPMSFGVGYDSINKRLNILKQDNFKGYVEGDFYIVELTNIKINTKNEDTNNRR